MYTGEDIYIILCVCVCYWMSGMVMKTNFTIFAELLIYDFFCFWTCLFICATLSFLATFIWILWNISHCIGCDSADWLVCCVFCCLTANTKFVSDQMSCTFLDLYPVCTILVEFVLITQLGLLLNEICVGLICSNICIIVYNLPYTY